MSAEAPLPPPCGHADCGASTGVAAEEPTFGRGALDNNGYWEIPCAPCGERHNARCLPAQGDIT